MLKSLKTCVLLIATLAQTTALAQSSHADTAEVLEEVVVTGVLPGPPRTNTSHVVVEKLKSNELKAWGKEAVIVMNSDSHREFEVGCLASKIAYFENDFESAKKRANAWARGDADELIRHAAALKNDVALQSLRGPCRSSSTANDATAMEEISHEKWLAAAEAALANNERTFAVLGINDVLAPDGLVARLQAQGHTVEVSAK